GGREPVNASGVMRGVGPRVRVGGAGRGVSPGFGRAAGLPAVPADTVQLQQVVLNLVVNAMEATAFAEDPREVTIGTVQAEPGLLRLSVHDTGAGVEASQLDKIFEPFVTTTSGGFFPRLSLLPAL